MPLALRLWANGGLLEPCVLVPAMRTGTGLLPVVLKSESGRDLSLCFCQVPDHGPPGHYMPRRAICVLTRTESDSPWNVTQQSGFWP